MSRARLERLKQLSRSDEEIYAWLTAGDEAWRDGEPLDRALGLTGPRAKAGRNRALLKAAEILDPDRRLSDWHLAGRLAKAIRRFEGCTLKHLRSGQEPQSELEMILLEAFRANNGRMLRSQARLYKTLFADQSSENGQ